MENPLTSKYKIYNEKEGITIEMPNGSNDLFFDADKSKYEIKNYYVTRFSVLDNTHGSLSGKIIQYTDTNGATSETVVNVDLLDDEHPVKTNDIEFDTDYLYILFKEKEQTDYIPVYIKIPV